MRDDDRLLDVPDPEFGSGVVGVCDICGERQAVIILSKERYKLCVIDFLNKAWLKTDKKPGAPLPLYRSDRIWFETVHSSHGKAPAIVLSPTKTVRRPAVLITPDVYGLTTQLLDAAIRFAREGFEVLLPDTGKTEGIGASHHVALRSGARLRGGVVIESKKVNQLLGVYSDALTTLRERELVDPAKVAVFGASYGGSLALALAARETRLAAVALAYPMPVQPAGLPALVTAPLLLVGGSADPAVGRARAQFDAVGRTGQVPLSVFELPGGKHGFLSRDLPAYDLPSAERAWTAILAFLKQQLMPPPPKPPSPPPRTVAAPSVPAAPAPTSSAAAMSGAPPARPPAPASS